jgi:hypothetical protein
MTSSSSQGELAKTQQAAVDVLHAYTSFEDQRWSYRWTLALALHTLTGRLMADQRVEEAAAAAREAIAVYRQLRPRRVPWVTVANELSSLSGTLVAAGDSTLATEAQQATVDVLHAAR